MLVTVKVCLDEAMLTAILPAMERQIEHQVQTKNLRFFFKKNEKKNKKTGSIIAGNIAGNRIFSKSNIAACFFGNIASSKQPLRYSRKFLFFKKNFSLIKIV